MNLMLYRVVNEGTGGMANLDFTNVAGKTGTSTGPKDAWFMGFTGKYVAGVWIGNDDNHPMRTGVTGGHQAAPVWHDLMTVAHTDMNIPTIPGLPMHPRQVEEQQRLAALKAAQVAEGLEPAAKAADTGKPESIMPDKTRAVLKTLTAALRKAEGGPGEPAASPSSTGTPPDPAKEKPAARPDRRATLFDTSPGEPTASSAQSAQ
jgi:penicillin-binding protein 1A